MNAMVVAMAAQVIPSLKNGVDTLKTPCRFEESNSPIPVSTGRTADDKILVTMREIIVLSCLNGIDGVPYHHG